MNNQFLLSEMIKQFWIHGSDKQEYHNYSVGYYEFLKNVAVNNMLEIGIWQGASVRAWADIYPDANIYGVDYNANLMFTHPRVHTSLMNQDSIESIQSYAKQTNVMFDFILDDGSHHFKHSKNCFEVLFDYLAPDGVYIIEDISLVDNFMSNYGLTQQKKDEIDDYLSKIDGINYKFIDCHYEQPRYTGSWMVGITRK